MNKDLQYYQNQTKEKLKSKFPTLSDEDLNFREGREKELMEMLAHKLQMTQTDLIKIIETI
jgi:hypothetical protein